MERSLGAIFWAITKLQRISSDNAVADIAMVLGDDKSQLRYHAVESLALTDNAKAAQLLVQALPETGIRPCVLPLPGVLQRLPISRHHPYALAT